MKNLNQLEFKQQLNKNVEDIFLLLFINKDLNGLSNILSPTGQFCTLNKYEFLEYLEKVFIDINYKLTLYEKKYSCRLKVGEVVHTFNFSSFDNNNFEYETLQMNLLLIIKNDMITSILSENELITEEEFEIRQFNN